MERVNTLISKLQEQATAGNNVKQLLSTAQLLVAELSGIELPEEIGKVSVWMPSVYFSAVAEVVATPKETIVAEEPIVATVVEEVIVPVEVESIKIIEEEKVIIPQSQPIEVTARRAAMVAVKPKEIYNFNVLVEDEEKEEEEALIPTLVMHDTSKEVFELNDVMHQETKSFNDILKQDKREVGNSIVETPVKDLRKAIGINEKYLYINELFQGDENMYERSIKTINSFTVFPEAEHWIRRELYTKLCWINDNQTVKQFDQLIRRRFA